MKIRFSHVVIIFVTATLLAHPPTDVAAISAGSPSVIVHGSVPVIHDGVISAGEYDYSKTIHSGSGYVLHYSVNGTTLYIAIEISKTGWVGLGFKPNSNQDMMSNADIIISYYSGGANIRDDHATGSTSHSADSTQNILSFGGSESGGKTIMEFSRLLNTGDANDKAITLGSTTYLIWAYHNSADDFTTQHSNMGYNSIVFNAAPPSPPKNLNAVTGASSIDLTWDAPDRLGGASLLGYNVYRATSAGGPYTNIGTPTSTSFSDTTISAGTTYYYVVTAENSAGESANSNEASGGLSGTPDAPTGLSATPGDGQVDLSWTAPTNDGGSAITGYNVYRSTTSGSGYSLVTTTGTTPSYTDTGLTNSITYYYVVAAVNANGEGTLSSEASATPTGKAAPPQNLIATRDGSSVNLTWGVPATDGGNAITGYKIYRGTSSGSYPTFVASTTQLTYLDSGVTLGNTYYYVVTAENSAGESAYSGEARVTMADVPDAPANVVVSNGDNTVSISWDAPFDHGFGITEYTIYRAPNATGPFVSIGTNPSNLGYVDSSVSNGQEYYYRISATNANGESSFSQVASAYPATTASAPNLETAEILKDEIRISWSAPSDNGGYEVTSYILFRSVSDETNYVKINQTSGLGYNDTDVSVGSAYFYKVAAVNQLGAGDNSTSKVYSVFTAPGAPTNFNLELNGTVANLTWAPPTFDGGKNISSYRVYRSQVSGKFYTLINETANTTVVDENLFVGSSYYYVVSAINAIGESEFSAEINVTLGIKPLSPRNLVAVTGTNRVTLNWTPPISDGGSDITNYIIYRAEDDEEVFEKLAEVEELSYIDPMISVFKSYRYKVTAVNQFGESGFSNTVSVEFTAASSPGETLPELGLDQNVILLGLALFAVGIPAAVITSLFTGKKARETVLTDENLAKMADGLKTVGQGTLDGVKNVGKKITDRKGDE